MAKKNSRPITLGTFVFIKDRKAKKKAPKTLGYIRAKSNEEGFYEIVTIISAGSGATVRVATSDIEPIPIPMVKQALCDAEDECSFDEFSVFVNNHNQFKYKVITIPAPVKESRQ